MRKNAATSSYDASDIEVLEGLEPVRKRPGMYIAGTDTPAGLHQLVFEILDNSVDEAMNGYADRIEITLHKDRESVTVKDNGRGIPVEKHPKFKKSALEIILTTLHAGGKFSDKNYKTAGGLHGVGSSVVNALSAELIATVRRGGKEFRQRFERGVPKSKLETVKDSIRGTGTEIFFRPDAKIFKETTFSSSTLRDAIQTKAFLNPGLQLRFVDEAGNSDETFCFEDGLRAYLEQLMEKKKAKPVGGEVFFIHRDAEIDVTLALAWTESPKETYHSYANGIYTVDGGAHEIGAKSGIVKAVRNYISVHDISLKGTKLTADDIREGLVCLVSVKLPGDLVQAQFQGQTKSRLNNPEVTPVVEGVARAVEQLLNEKPTAAESIVQRIILAAKAREASRAASQNVRRKIGVSHRLTLPGKLADCSSTRSEDCELFIVEGDSAGGSTKQGRDRATQAVLPLRGKVLNTIASPNKKITENKELSNIVSAIGCGVGDAFDLDKLRYGKVIILTDADADGMHIATLLIGFFFQYMRPLVEAGHLYLGKPPLYGVFARGMNGAQSKAVAGKSAGKKQSSGKTPSVYWAYSDDELQEITGKKGFQAARITRYKGLGEMNPETLWETTLDPELRTLLRVTLDDEALVSEALKALMGSDPSERTRLIQDCAEQIQIDV